MLNWTVTRNLMEMMTHQTMSMTVTMTVLVQVDGGLARQVEVLLPDGTALGLLLRLRPRLRRRRRLRVVVVEMDLKTL